MGQITGTTRDASGATLGSCTVKAFRTSDNVCTATGTSDVDGTYTLTVPGVSLHYVAAFKDGPLAGLTADDIEPVATLDTVTEAFRGATGITDDTITNAIDGLVVALKNANIWASIHALWPFVGGTADTHKYNLVDPRDADDAYRISWSGPWVHDANGITPDNSSTYGNTHLSPTDVLTTASGSVGIYSRTSATGSGNPYDFAVDDGDVHPICVIARYTSSRSYCVYGDNGFNPNFANSDGVGFYATNRKSTSFSEAYQNGSQVTTAIHAVSMPASGLPLFIGANNKNGTPSYFSNKNLALAYVSDGLTGSEHATLYTTVQDFQTALGRNV